MAIFVEGRTELEFDSKLIQEIARGRNITIEPCRIRGGTNVPTRVEFMGTRGAGDPSQATHLFMLYNCGNDTIVKDRAIQYYPTLVAAGFEKIICHRDVAPSFCHSEIAALEAGLRLRVKTKPIVVTFVLSVMEIEAWFLAEHSHFANIDPAITLAAITSSLSFDPANDDMRLRPNPAVDLANCYALAGKHYDKLNTQPTIDAVDCVSVYVEIAEKFPHLLLLCKEISDFLEDAQGQAT
jgi:hypothetical protein